MKWTIPLFAVMLVMAATASLHIGLRIYAPSDVVQAILSPTQSQDDLIIRGLRVPRTAGAIFVGAALAVAGLLMQTVLRNPLADPGLLGINAGASFGVVFGFAVLGISGFVGLSLAALLGSAIAMLGIFALVTLGKGRLTPTSVVLAGVTLAAFLGSITQILIVTDEGTMEALLFWLAGGFADRDPALLWAAAPMLALGICGVCFFTHALDAMVTGDDTARALGVDTTRMRIFALCIATVLAALSVVVAGPVGFVGLVAPHLARLLSVQSHTQLLPLTALIGACLAILADIAARLVASPQEVPVTATLALVGAPVLVSLVRRRKLRATA
ncbi:FecCD family ABC transporter permease [Loktanella agnita]|uniref:FecCD family ABC transporter permease n=1 Tax=Loktanella agnita TaxID=287097 RepID=UPI003985C2E7